MGPVDFMVKMGETWPFAFEVADLPATVAISGTDGESTGVNEGRENGELVGGSKLVDWFR